jgi:hypothetical protein
MEENRLGFQTPRSIWDCYIGKLVVFSGGQNSICGVLKEVNKPENYMDFQPSLVTMPGDGAVINKDFPTRISTCSGLMKPVPETMTLEQVVENYNAQLKRDRTEE